MPSAMLMVRMGSPSPLSLSFSFALLFTDKTLRKDFVRRRIFYERVGVKKKRARIFRMVSEMDQSASPISDLREYSEK